MDEYERATGHPWFSSPAMLGGEIHLVPVVALRDRGVLDQDIRRGLVHLMVDGPLGGRSAWVREGAALYYADAGPGTPPAGRISCPSDSELERPVSAGALSNALSRAKGCFAKQIGSGKTWKDVR
jgi:hypothetical protein